MLKAPANSYSCVCGKILGLKDQQTLRNHVNNCKQYHKNSPFAELFFGSDLTKLAYGELLTLQFEFELYQKILSDELMHQTLMNSNDDNPKSLELKKGVSLNFESKTEIKLKKFSSIYHNFDDSKPGALSVSDSLFKCLKCRKFFYDDESLHRVVLGCGHQFCKACAFKAVNTQFIKNNGSVKCLFDECESHLQENDYKALMGAEKFNKLNEEMLEKMLNIVSCVKCREKFEFIRGKPDPHMKDNLGKPLTLTLALHFAENRFVCPKCKAEQCKTCKAAPFHLGFTCESFKKKLCLYCEIPIDLPLSVPESDDVIANHVCSSVDCQSKLKNSCHKKLPCGHFCRGFSNELACLPCFIGECAAKNAFLLLDQKGSDYCNICFVESLESCPCIQVSCGHIYHLDCISKRLEIRWTKPRISFNFCLCPLCKQWMTFPKESPLQAKMLENLSKLEVVKSKALDRLKYEAKDKDPRLFNPQDPFFSKPLDYAIAIYSYYECFKCKGPYFGGLKRCEDMLEVQGLDKPFKPTELICPLCCDIPIDNCPKHGTEYIEFKCTYCCSLAQWFCWGTTHFCDPCHERINAGDDLTKYAREKLPLCKGKEECPLKIEHKPNGEECALGCSLCREYKEGSKDF